LHDIDMKGGVMYAIVGASKLKPGATPEVTQNILNGLSEVPGFISGAIAWSTDRERGRSMFLFETEDAAKAAMEGALSNMPADAPMEIESAEVCEVVAHT
jgi:hypothetical protein